MAAYRYYRTVMDGPSAWKVCDEDAVDQVIRGEAMHIAMLAVDTLFTDDTPVDRAQVRYYGDMVIDIDHGTPNGDDGLRQAITESIKSANKVVEFFSQLFDPEFLLIYASGKKGFHIVIPAKLIHSSKSMIRDLPKIYAMMAKEVEIATGATGIDYGLYAGGRGHTVRLPNKRRAEGTYKVEISVRDLALMTCETYKDYVAAPRNPLQRPRISGPAIELVKLYLKAKAAADARQEMVQIAGIPDEALEGFGTTQHPECVSKLVHWDGVNPDANYNQLAMQMAIYLRAAGVPGDVQDIMVQDFANNGHSSSYPTPEQRVRHLLSHVAPSTADMKFSCQAMRSIVNIRRECLSCPIFQQLESDSSAASQITATDQGYITFNAEGQPRTLTNFQLDIQELHLSKELVGRMTEDWVGGVVSVTRNGSWIMDLQFLRSAFETRKEFETTFGQIRNGRIDVNDRDVKNIKQYLMRLHEGVNGMKPTNAVGLRRHTFYPDGADEPVTEMVWVEPKWSIASSGLTSSFRLTEDVEFVVKHEHRGTSRSMTPEYSETILHLLQCTAPHIVGSLLGCAMAAQLKEHIFHRVKEFPSVNIEGVSGAGKSQTSALFAALSSADYFSAQAPFVPGMTPVPMRAVGTSSYSIVRIIDECTKPKIIPQKWQVIREIIKASSQQSSIQTGTLKAKTAPGEHGSAIINEKIIAPIWYLSTCEVDEPELWNRAIVVKFNKRLHQVPTYRTHFNALHGHQDQYSNLFAVARILMLNALYLKEEKAWEWFCSSKERISTDLDARVRNAYTWMFAGLDYFGDVMSTAGAAQDVLDVLAEVQNETWRWFLGNLQAIHTAKNRNEIDGFFERLDQTAARMDNQDRSMLRKGLHYIRDNDTLYIQLSGTFPLYILTCRWLGQTTEFTSAEALKKAIQYEDYYLGEERKINGSGIPLPWIKVSISKLEARGHDLGRFEE